MNDQDTGITSSISNIVSMVFLGVSAYCYLTETSPATLLKKIPRAFDRMHYPCQVAREQAEAASYERGYKEGWNRGKASQ